MARTNLNAVLGDDDPVDPPRRRTSTPPPAAAPAPLPASTSADQYKLTARLEDDEAAALERLTDHVVTAIAPRRVGKGWRTKVIRALVKLAADDDVIRRKVIAEVKRLR